MKTALLTGACGFIGAWTADALDRAGWSVRAYDAQPRREPFDFVRDDLAARIDLVKGDVTDAGSLRAAAAGADAIIHLAGLMTVDCRDDPMRGATINVLGSVAAFEAARHNGIRRLAYLSTAAVYAPDDPEHPRPMSFYGAWKLAAEGAARSWWLDHGLPSTGFRPWIVYGPGESAGISAGPSIACRGAATGTPARIRFTGNVGFVHVADVAAALTAAIDRDGDGAHVHDLGGIEASVDEFIRAVRAQVPDADVAGEGPPLRIPQRLAGGDKAAWLDRLGVTGLDEGIARTIAHYRAQSRNGDH